MKNKLKKLLESVLRFFAAAILNKYQPQVIGITGSVGKTSAKEAVYAVLATTYNVRRNVKNYNNEIGIPLTIIGAETGGKSLVKWLCVFIKALWLVAIKNKKYPNILILEMGADRPGDISYLVNFIPVEIGVVTSVAPVHLEFFETIDNIAQEKGALIRGLPENGFALLNHDDELVNKMQEETKAKVMTYGLMIGADISATDIGISGGNEANDISGIKGISFKLNYHGSVVPIFLPQVLGEHLVYAALAAIGVGLACELNLYTITEGLKKFEPPRGRMRLISGIKNTLIIDDTYNSSPLAAAKALAQLNQIKLAGDHSKYAVLGDMLELGKISEQAHREIGQTVANYKIDYLITVGEMSRDTMRGAIEAGMAKERCFNFPNSSEAGLFLQQRLAEGDLILVKGSQGMRMERIVKEVMAEPLKAGELLVRQDKEWQRS